MNSEARQILEAVKAGSMSIDDALLEIKKEPFEDIGYAKVDLHRKIRQGAAEVIYGAGKTPEQMIGIVSAMLKNGQDHILITRLSSEAADMISQVHPLHYHKDARVGIIGEMPKPTGKGKIVVATGGTSDIPVAEEAALTAEIHANEVVRLYDVGVASVIGGLADCPVIAVPTSVGYGASFGGVSALLSMLNSCASGVSVVNIDNGFGAGYLAGMMNHM